MKKLVIIFTIFCFTFSWFLPVRADETGTESSETIKPSLPQLTEAEKEVRIGNLFDLYATETFVVLKDKEIIKNVSRIAEKIVRASGQPNLKYKIRIINDPLPIASSFPGGYIYISTGLLDILETKDELAAVLADALTPLFERYQYDAFMDEWKQRKTALVASRIFALVLFAGGVALGAAAASSAASGAGLGVAQAYQQTSQMVSTITSGAAMGALSAGAAAAKKLPEKKVILSRMSPYLSIGDPATSSSVFVFFKEIYEGYDTDKELNTVESAIKILKRAGYNPKALVSLFKKLITMRNEYISRGYVSSLLIAQPNLEGRIERADKTIENSK